MAEEEDSEWLSSKIKGFTFADDDEVIITAVLSDTSRVRILFGLNTR